MIGRSTARIAWVAVVTCLSFASTASGAGDAGNSAPAPAVDPTTLTGKALFGYQGWFACPGDGSRVDSWFHWFREGRLMVDYWPDPSEYSPGEGCATNLSLPNGEPLMAYSAHRASTVARHFEWMETYGIDGVFLQRFITEVREATALLSFRNTVTENVRGGAETHGRVFAVMYDLNGAGPSTVEDVIRDWEFLVDEMRVTDSPAYVHHAGRPVVGLWGIGFNHVTLTPEQAATLVAFFQADAPEDYRATVVGGVPTHWRTLTGDAHGDPAWMPVFRSLDVLSPWSVGRYQDNATADAFRDAVLAPDLEEAAAAGVGYMPVVWPGFSWHNLYPEYPVNQIPRNGGHFYWRQVVNALSLNATLLYVAMFDEVDEGTAMFKLAATRDELPVGADLVPLDVDGYRLPSDWYLRLGGATGRAVRGEIPLSHEFPLQPDVVRPTVEIRMPGSGARAIAGNVTVTGAASDDVAVSRVDVRVDGGGWERATGTASWWAVVTVPPGPHTLEARAVDSSGHPTTTTTHVTAIDRTPPSVTILSPAQGSTVSNAVASVRGTADDDWGIHGVELRVGWGPWQRAEGTRNWSGSVALAEGSNRISARVTDAHGNTAVGTIRAEFVGASLSEGSTATPVGAFGPLAALGAAARVLRARRRTTTA